MRKTIKKTIEIDSSQVLQNIRRLEKYKRVSVRNLKANIKEEKWLSCFENLYDIINTDCEIYVLKIIKGKGYFG